jgi:hypothetical protein
MIKKDSISFEKMESLIPSSFGYAKKLAAAGADL